MKTLKRLLIGVSFLSLLGMGISCSEDDDNIPKEGDLVEVTLDEGFLSGIWKYESITSDTPVDYNNDGIKSNDVLSQYDPTVQDNILGFKTNGLRYEVWDNMTDQNILQNILEEGTYSVYKSTVELTAGPFNKTYFLDTRAFQEANGVGGFRDWVLKYRDEDGFLVVLRDAY
ncbi:MAG: hypothetical protein ACK5MD_09630 [Flavobacteriales bacterium]